MARARSRRQSENPWRRYLPFGVAIGAVLAGALVVRFAQPDADYPTPETTPNLAAQRALAQAQDALARRDFVAAEQSARRVLQSDPQSVPALLVAGEAATHQQRFADARAYYAAVPDDGTEEGLAALWSAGTLLLHEGRAAEAEDNFRRVLAHDPDHVIANRYLAFLLHAQGRNWESEEHLFRLVRQREFTLEELFLLTYLERTVDQREYLEFCLQSVPDDVRPNVGLARLAWAHDDLHEGLQLIRPVIEQVPHEPAAQIIFGYLLQQSGKYDQLLGWHEQLPAGVADHPEIWFLRGRWAEETGELRAAARCYWEAVRRNPNHVSANYRLSQLLVALDQPAAADRFLQRSRDLDELTTRVEPIEARKADRQRMIQVAQLCESLGRLWEAWAWYDVLLRYYPDEISVRPHWQRLAAKLERNPPRTLASANPALMLDLSSYPLPKWQSTAEPASTQLAAEHDDTPRFVDLASAANIDFEYFNNNDPEIPGMQLYQQMGGGIAVLDFDGNGWPDIYLSQGCEWPPESGQTQHVDRLYRNMGNGTFQEVTAAANLGNDRYGQGVAVGDFNGDGFPDLYVANIGGNRLYRNEGDGTFTEVTLEAGIRGDQWTTSCLMVDLNGNGLPDIYDVNYLVDDALVTQCRDGDKPRSCSPVNFDAQQDRLWMNLGDGRFQEVTDTAGIVASHGKGLGIVAADFEGTGRLNLFVANDTDANFFFVNQTTSPDQPPNFTDEALLSGLAFDEHGRSQACMGIAIDDATGDGFLDMLVTNFYNEANAFYRQQSGRLFVDAIRPAGMRDASFPELGFGTQFLDANLNGRPDLVVTNGHVDDFRFRGEPFKMRPQFFQNVGQGRFVELPAESLGDYFQGRYLGRGLARLDWDRDGRDDFLVMHLHDPLALLTNRTANTGNFLALHFRGTQSNRDAIGTRVELIVGGDRYYRQLTAGDGFHASNQRRLTCGLGNAQQVDRLVVRWPSGLEQSFEDVAVNQELILVEGQPEPVPMPGP